MAALATAADWTARASEVDVPRRAFIDGGFADALGGETFACRSPIDGRLLADVAACQAADVDRAVTGARAAFEAGGWSRAAPKERKRVLLRLAELIREHADELALLETLDMGKPIREARDTDVRLAAECVQYYGEAVDKVYDEIAPTARDAVAMIYREPLGVVGAVVPWNFPLLMATWKLAPALAIGQQRPAQARRAVAADRAAGRSAGRRGRPARGRAAGPARRRTRRGPAARPSPRRRHDRVHRVDRGRQALPALRRRVEHEARLARVRRQEPARHPPRLPRPAGGAATAAALGVFYNQGEVCNAGTRVVVHEQVRDEFMDLLLEAAREIQPGNPLDPGTTLGAMVDETQTERVLGYIDTGRSEGADLVLGGSRVLADSGGWYIEPTVFDRVRNDMTIAREEIFGPVLATIDVASEDEAIAVANDTMYGLAAAVWTESVDTAHRVARAIRAGVVWVNTFDAGDITTPFGGFKQSGFGRDKSIHALEKYADLKTVWIGLRS